MVIKKAIYVWVIGILGMISFAACSTASQGEAPSTSNAALDNIFARKSVRWIIMVKRKVCELHKLTITGELPIGIWDVSLLL